MADGRDQSTGFNFRATFPWTEIFRCFQVALDPRKLLVAAAGILVMAFLWYVLSAIFWYKHPDRNEDRYSTGTISKEYEDKKKPGTTDNYTEADHKAIGDARYHADLEQWKTLDSLAGPGGKLRTLPWYEYRGPNPYLFVSQLSNLPASQWGDAVYQYLKGQVPVVTEPLVKLLLPVIKLISPGVSPWTRLFLFLVILVNIAVWAFFGGIITRLAAVQLANKGPISLKQAFTFVCKRYVNYLSSPLVPLAIIGAVVVGLCVYGLLSLIPIVGDIVLLGAGLPLVIAAGAVMAVFVVGLVGYPLMYPTLSVEGDASDMLDALSRSINYVYQNPWQYLWYGIVAVVYGAAVTFFVLFFSSLMVYMGKWAVSLPASVLWSDRKPDYLFVYAPESFGWREVLLKGSPYAVAPVVVAVPASDRQVVEFKPVNPAVAQQNREDFNFYHTWGAGIVAFWLVLFFLMMLGFSYSFFWSAATMIYYLMRKKVDEIEPDEVFLEDEEPEAPLAPPKIADGTLAPAGSGSLPVIVPPPASPPPPPATIPFSPPPPPPPPPAVMSPPPPPHVVSPPPHVVMSPPPPPPPRPEPKPPEPPPKKPADDDAPLG